MKALERAEEDLRSSAALRVEVVRDMTGEERKERKRTPADQLGGFYLHCQARHRWQGNRWRLPATGGDPRRAGATPASRLFQVTRFTGHFSSVSLPTSPACQALPGQKSLADVLTAFRHLSHSTLTATFSDVCATPS